jgi:hypothetical protein
MGGGPVETDPYRCKQRLAETSRELQEQLSELERHLGEDPEELVPHVVGGVTRMQELLDDLLAFSRYAGAAAGGLASILLSSSHVD